VNQVIQGLEQQRQRQQEAAEEAAALLARTELLHEELLARWEQQKEQSAELQEQRRRELERSIREGQGEVRSLIRRLRRGAAAADRGDGRSAGEVARQAGQRLRRLERDHQPRPERRQHRGWQPAVGDRVRLLALGRAAEVLEISEDRRELTVRCGVLRLQVELGAVEGLQGEKPTLPEPVAVRVQTRQRSGGPGPQVRTDANTVDVRGLRVHEAEAAVETELDRMKKELVSETELQKVKNKTESMIAFEDMSVMSRANSLAYYELLGDATWINMELEKYAAVTREEILEESRQIFRPENSSTLHYLSNNK
jgi:DNA mismatch repair protein MutS2